MSVKKSDLRDVAYEKILHKILHYELSPGEVVSVLNLAQVLNMSRTPVREAVVKLIEDGLIVVENGKNLIKSISLNDINEIYQLREAIETMCVKIIIKNNGGLTDKQKKHLENIQSKFKMSIENEDFEMNFELDKLFHESLIDYAGNERMSEISKKMQIQSQRFRWLTKITPKHYEITLKDHQDILDSIYALDLVKGKDSVIKHMENSLDGYKNILENNEWKKTFYTMSQLF
ncbi:GntR family transcriptional regulator [Clostridium grantii]|uniref:DNA-binding transcriptional regulator, GntR family n=1 Tax=Clostridium grantii DSM 8605 TaxID=1121316 RepID=A0A1M5WA79_9CLOT|nr:GntR family transcriptional regulator [Clostridium grantii]SHH84360.1 DNA-binding transcriptional regulator, GntR family [Clostridium grantii DSM 8605]